MVFQAFAPRFGSTQQLSPAAVSATSTIDAQKTCKQVRIVNTGASKCYVRTFSALGAPSSISTATAADHLVMPGMATTITKDQDHDTLAHISAAGTTIEVSIGEGL